MKDEQTDQMNIVLLEQGWKHPKTRSPEMVGQTNINTCRLSERNKQNINAQVIIILKMR